MKTKLQHLGLIISLLLFPFIGNAYDFEVDGIYYNITSPSNLEVEVTYKDQTSCGYNGNNGDYYYRNDTYEGDIIIPNSVNYNNKRSLVSTKKSE